MRQRLFYKLACVGLAVAGVAASWLLILYVSFIGTHEGLLIVVPLLSVLIWLSVQTVRQWRLNTLSSFVWPTVLAALGLLLLSVGVLFNLNPPGY